MLKIQKLNGAKKGWKVNLQEQKLRQLKYFVLEYHLYENVFDISSVIDVPYSFQLYIAKDAVNQFFKDLSHRIFYTIK